MAKDFKILNQFDGYINKKDLTNVKPNYLVTPSKNVFINDGDKVEARPGFTIFGATNSATTPIVSSFEWNTSTGTELALRSYDDELEFYYSGSWRRLKDAFTAVDFNFATWWDNTEKLDKLVFVNGTPNLYAWGGGVATLASKTVNTLTKTGTTSWAEERFFTAGSKSVVINGTTYAYTGGEGTTTLTGVTPDPSGEADGSLVIQAIVTTANKPAALFNNDVIGVLNNQLYVGDSTKRSVYISKNTDYTDYTAPSSPRIPGEAASLTPDSPPKAFLEQEEKMYVSCGKDEWYEIEFTLSADIVNEYVKIKRLQTAPGQGAISQGASAKTKNDIVFISNEPTLDTLGRVKDVTGSIQSTPLSDPIQIDFDGYDFTTTSPHVKYFRTWVVIAVPASDVVLIYDIEKQYWQPPWTMSISRLAIIDGDLYGHSSTVAETYKLLDGYNDNSFAIHSVAAFAYRNYGRRANKKSFNEYYSEGYVSTGTTIDLTLKYDFGGFTQITSKEISGSDSGTIFQTIADNSIGKIPLGQYPVGTITDSVSNLPKFRVIHETPKVDFWEYQAVYETNDVDHQWQLIAHGSNAYQSTTDNADIKR